MNEKQILIADDVGIIRAMHKQGIESHNPDYRVTIATNGLAALEQLRQQRFDLIITDYTMPEMNGLELAAEVRQRWPATPIVLMTAFGRNLPTDVVDALGFDDFVDKPFSLVEVLRLVDRLVARPRSIPVIR